MAISFNRVPTALRVPGTYIEIDGSRALSTQPGEPHRVLLIGLRLAAGSAPAGTIVEVTGEGAADGLFGAGSQLAAMAKAFARVGSRARLYALPVDPAGAGTAAAGTIALAGTATGAGTLTVRVGDRRVSVGVANGQTAAAIATALAAALTAEPDLPVTAGAAGGTVTLTARQAGTHGNDVALGVDVAPAGITPTVTASTGGATNPSLAASIAAIDDSRYDSIVSGVNDAANVALLETEAARRWDPEVKLPTHVFVALRGTLSAMGTYGAARNSQHLTIVGAGLSPTPPWVVVAQVAARDAQVTDTQPNRPRNGLVLPDVEAPAPADRLDQGERNGLLYDGVSTLRVAHDGRVLIERLITSYQVTPGGTADATYLSIETMRNLASTLLELLAVGARHERDLVAPDGTNVGPGVPVVTPATLRGELVAAYRSRERRGLAKDTAGFAADLLVEIDETNGERLNVQASPRLVNGLVVTAMKIAFQL